MTRQMSIIIIGNCAVLFPLQVTKLNCLFDKFSFINCLPAKQEFSIIFFNLIVTQYVCIELAITAIAMNKMYLEVVSLNTGLIHLFLLLLLLVPIATYKNNTWMIVIKCNYLFNGIGINSNQQITQFLMRNLSLYSIATICIKCKYN